MIFSRVKWLTLFYFIYLLIEDGNRMPHHILSPAHVARFTEVSRKACLFGPFPNLYRIDVYGVDN